MIVLLNYVVVYVVFPSYQMEMVSVKEGSKLKNMNVNLVMRLMKYSCINGRVGFSSFLFVLTQIVC